MMITSRAVLVSAVALVFACGGGDDPTGPSSQGSDLRNGLAMSANTGSTEGTSDTIPAGPRIVTDKEDYVPHEHVGMIGTGWQPGETVTLTLTEDPQIHPSRTFTVLADTLGNFGYDEFTPEDHHAGVRFILAAVGQSSGFQAQTTFTDAIALANFSTNFNGSGSNPSSPSQTELVMSAPAVSAAQVALGAVLIAQVTITDDVGSTDICVPLAPAGWEPVITTKDQQNKVAQEIFYRVVSAPAGATSSTWRFRGTCPNTTNRSKGAAGGIILYTGVDVSDPIDDAQGRQGISSTTTGTAPEATASASGSRVIRFFGVFKQVVASPTTTPPRIYSRPSNTIKEVTAAAFDADQASAGGTGTFTATFNNFPSGSGTTSAEWVAQTVVLKMAAVANQPPTANHNGPYSGAEGSPVNFSSAGSSDPDGDALGYLWNFGDGNTSTAANPTHTFTDNGNFTVTLTVTAGAHSSTVTTTAAISNVAPSATGLNTNSPVNEGGNITLSLAGVTDPSSVDASSLEYAFDCGSGYGAFGAANSASCATTDNGSRTVKGKVKDKDGGESTDYQATVTINNVNPTATFSATPNIVVEGQGFTLALANPLDPSSADVAAGFTYAFDCGSGYGAGGTATTASCTTSNNGALTVKGKITDKDAGFTEYTTTVTVTNAAPQVTIVSPQPYSVWSITGFAYVTDLVHASFTDVGTGDTHTCTVNWGDGDAAIAGVVNESAGSGTCKLTPPNNPYQDDGAGIFTITVTVSDGTDNGSASVTIVVYDPSAGFVTGGGWIDSPAGACRLATCSETTIGRANFGFVSKYQKGASVPTGNTEFQFHAGNLNFHSSNYEWLLVSTGGAAAQYKGTGTINGAGSYKFMLWAQDGTSDKFRIKIYLDNGGTETILYDNGFDQSIGGGSIVIHTGGKK